MTVTTEPVQLDPTLAEWFGNESGAVVVITPADDVDGTYATWFAEHDCTWALQRPDFHVHGVASDGNGAPGPTDRPPAPTDRPPARRQDPRGSDSMKIANANGRATLVVGDEIVDVESSSDGVFSSDPMSPYDDWPAFRDFAREITSGTGPLVEADLRCPVTSPHQVFAIGLNYRSHAKESGMELPTVPATFTKFPASLTGPFDDVTIPNAATDWEVELVAVIGRRADRVDERDAWTHIAGLTVGQDISDRILQFAAGGQFSLGKSHRGFGPLGPWVITVDEFDNPDDLALGCSVDGETMQDARTSDLVFSVPNLVAELSAVLPLLPGDIIFTGTPSGIGATRQPARFLQPGQLLETWVEGIGTIRNRCV